MFRLLPEMHLRSDEAVNGETAKTRTEAPLLPVAEKETGANTRARRG